MVFISSPKCNAASFCHESPIILHTKFNKLQNITFVLIPKPFTINGFSLNKFAMKSDCFLCNSLPAVLRENDSSIKEYLLGVDSEWQAISLSGMLMNGSLCIPLNIIPLQDIQRRYCC